MNWRHIILLFGLFEFCCSKEKTAPGTLTLVDISNYNVVERIKSKSDFFTEIILTADSLIENGAFNRLVLYNGDQKVYEIIDIDAYDSIDSGKIEINNLVDSKFLLVQKVDDIYYLSLFGAQYGCCARKLTIISVSSQEIKEIFSDEFQVHKISTDKSGEIKYFGIDSFSEPLYPIDSLDVLLFTYNPTLVYTLNNDFTFDSLTTRKYNEQTYVFGGFTYDAEIKVAFPKDSKERNSGQRKPFIFRD